MTLLLPIPLKEVGAERGDLIDQFLVAGQGSSEEGVAVQEGFKGLVGGWVG